MRSPLPNPNESVPNTIHLHPNRWNPIAETRSFENKRVLIFGSVANGVFGLNTVQIAFHLPDPGAESKKGDTEYQTQRVV